MPNNNDNDLIRERQQVKVFFVATLSFLKSTHILNFPFSWEQPQLMIVELLSQLV